MFEKRFLAYILHVSLLDIRYKSYANRNRKSYWLSDLLNNIPFCLIDERSVQEEYEIIIKRVEEMKIDNWIEARKKDFYLNNPTLSSLISKDFLSEILYITILEIRVEAVEQTNEEVYLFSNLIHRMSSILLNNALIMNEYERFSSEIDALNLNSWLDEKKSGFYKRYPEYLG